MTLGMCAMLCFAIMGGSIIIASEIYKLNKNLEILIAVEGERNSGEITKREHIKNLGLDITQFNQEFKGMSNTLRRIADKNKDQ